jgi:tRNA nucleotidyltransferase (CCA-adding enzyme)
MKILSLFKTLPAEIQEVARQVHAVARKEGMKVYIVGGFVRDLFLKRRNFDVDIVVEGDGIRFAEAYASVGGGEVIRHRRFGTATVVSKNGLKVDVATARKESYPAPASLPVVARGTLQDDLFRRDFTINAMAISLGRDDLGGLVDLFHGKEDSRQGKVRILHERSFIDDPTRILRGIRFEQRYGFTFESKTWQCLKQAVAQKMIEKVEPQRIRDELILTLKEPDPSKVLNRLQKVTGFGFIHRRVALRASGMTLLRSVRREVDWFKRHYPHRRQIDAWLMYLCVLLEPLTTRECLSVCKKFAFRKGEAKRIISYKEGASKVLRQLRARRMRPSQVFHLLEPLSYEVILLVKAKSSQTIVAKHIDDFLGGYNGVRLAISGKDLQEAGIQPGPLYQKIFKELLDEKLDGNLRSKHDEVAAVRTIVGKR